MLFAAFRSHNLPLATYLQHLRAAKYLDAGYALPACCLHMTYTRLCISFPLIYIYIYKYIYIHTNNSISIHYSYVILLYIHILPIACLFATYAYIPLIAYLTTICYLCPTHLRLISYINPPTPHLPHHRGRGQPPTLPRYPILTHTDDKYVHVYMCVYNICINV